MVANRQTYLTRYTFIKRLSNEKSSADWETFNRSYGKFIGSLIRRMRVNRNDCDDLTQEIMIKLWKNLDKFEPNQSQGSFRCWITVITRNTVYNYFRKEKSERRLRETFDSLYNQDEMVLPEEDFIEEEWRRNIATLAFRNITSKVSDQHLQIFCASSDGESVASLAERFNLPEHKIYRYKKRVEVLLTREIKFLKEYLE